MFLLKSPQLANIALQQTREEVFYFLPVKQEGRVMCWSVVNVPNANNK